LPRHPDTFCHVKTNWLSTANIQFPYELLALASSKDGQALLEGFNFFKIQNATIMPDRVPLFGLELADKRQLVLISLLLSHQTWPSLPRLFISQHLKERLTARFLLAQ